MLTLLLKRFTKLLKYLIVSTLIIATIGSSSVITTYLNQGQYCSYSIQETYQQRQYDVIIRVGEYPNKAGKRIYINNQTVHIPDDIPIRNDKDGKGFYVHEYDINKKLATHIVKVLQANGVNATLQDTKDKTQDLNSAARLSNKVNPKLYISIHHNYYDSDSTGYFAITNEGDTKAKEIANQLTNSIRNNQVPQRQNQLNTNNYIGELNHIHETTTPILLEMGFFSNLDELEKICSNEHVNFISIKLANEIVSVLNNY